MSYYPDYSELDVWRENLRNGRGVIYEGCATGLSHHDYQRYKDRIIADTRLSLRPDPENKYDKNAAGLFFDGRQIGWIPKGWNGPVARALSTNLMLSVIVTAHRPNNQDSQKRLFIRVEVFDSQPQVQEQFIMAQTKVSNVVQKNVDLGTSATFLEAGRIANKQLSGVAGKKLPIMVRAYADTALGRLLLANVALMARDHFRPDDERLGKLVNAMTVSAYQEVLQNFDVEQMIDDLVSNSTIKKALKSIDALPAAAD